MPYPMGQPGKGLDKRPVFLPFAQGVDTKDDPLQIKPGKLASLVNAVFNKTGRIDKRNGFGSLTTLSSATGQQITSYQQGNSLVAYGPNQVQVYDQQANSWIQAGAYNPMSVKTTPVVQNNTDIRNGTIAFDPVTGRYCTTVQPWLGVAQYQVFDKYNVAIIPPVTLSGSYARAYKVGNYFIVTYHSSGPALSYIAIPITNPGSPNAPVQISNGTVTATPASGSATLGGITVNTFEYGFSSNAYTAQFISGATHGTETGYFQGDNNNDGSHCDLGVFMSTGVSTKDDMAGAINAVASPPTTTQGSTTVNCFYTTASGSATVTSASATQFTGGSNPSHDAVVAGDGNLYIVVSKAAFSQAFTGTTVNASPTVTGVSSFTNLIVGQVVTGTNIPANTTILSMNIGAGTITLSHNATGANTGLTAACLGGLIVAKITTGLSLTVVSAATALLPGFVTIANDATANLNYISWLTSDSKNIAVSTWDYSLNNVLAASSYAVTQATTTVGLTPKYPIISLTSVVQNTGSVVLFFQERDWYSASQPGVVPTYFMSASQRNDRIRSLTVNSSGTVTVANHVVMRGVGMMSQPIIFNGVGYLVVNYQSPLEPTNFLIDFSGNIYAKMGSQKTINGSENSVSWYLPEITLGNDPVTGNQCFFVPHLVVDQLISIQKIPGNPFPTGIYTFAGLSYDTIQFNISTASSAEIADVLHLAGGFPWMYDTCNVVEHGFHVYPDLLLLTANGGTVGNSFTQYWYATYEWVDSTGKLHKSAPSFPIRAGALDNNGNFTFNIPTLRLTAKKNVQICLYRWSQSQPTPYFVASGVNDPTVDFISIVDSSGSAGNDVVIQGNRTLYTWGGELEDIAAPACISMSMFRARLFVVSSEDQNQLYFTKQCIEGVPAEFAAGFQMFIAPTISAAGPTGVVQALYPLDDKLIIFKTNAIYYIVGNGPDNTGQLDDFSDPIFITSSVGCSNRNSAIMIPDGVMFQSPKGLWLLGRDLSTNYIGAPVEDFVNGHTVISAVQIPGANHIRLTLENGTILIYDYFFKQWGVFTLANGAVCQDSCIYNNLHTLLNQDGTILQETAGTYLDGASPVAMSLQTGWYALAGIQGYQRAYWFNLIGTYLSAHNLSVQIDYDYNTNNTQNVTLTPDATNPEQFRCFLNPQKCQAFRLTITEQPSTAGQGLTLSGLNLVVGGKFGQYPRLKPGASFG